MSDTNIRDLTRTLTAAPTVEALAAFERAADRLGLSSNARIEVLVDADAVEAAEASIKTARAALFERIEAARAADAERDKPCESCGGRGRVVVWDTLDSLHSDGYAEYSACTACGGRIGPLDMTRWSHRYDGGQLRTAATVAALLPGWTVAHGHFMSPDEQGELAALDSLASLVKAARERVATLARPERGSRVVVAKGRPKLKSGAIVKVGTTGVVRWESREDDRVGFVVDGTDEMAFTSRGNLRCVDIFAERERRDAAAVEAAAKVEQAKRATEERRIFRGAIVRGPDGRVGEVFWMNETRLGIKHGPAREDVTWAAIVDVEQATDEAARAYREANPLPRARGRRRTVRR